MLFPAAASPHPPGRRSETSCVGWLNRHKRADVATLRVCDILQLPLLEFELHTRRLPTR
jgi:hypothetical protein